MNFHRKKKQTNKPRHELEFLLFEAFIQMDTFPRCYSLEMRNVTIVNIKRKKKKKKKKERKNPHPYLYFYLLHCLREVSLETAKNLPGLPRENAVNGYQRSTIRVVQLNPDVKTKYIFYGVVNQDQVLSMAEILWDF